MGRTSETTVIIGAKTKGFVRAGQEAAKITKAAASAAKEQLKNTKDVEKELGRMGSQLKDLARHQVSLNREMEKVGKATDTYKRLSGQLKEVNKQQDELQRSARNVERAFKDQSKAVTSAQMARGGFAQGLVQGVAPGAFIQRGPGMRQQMVGMAVGRAARGVVGGLARAPFSGLSGIGQALAAIPGGGIIGGPMMLAAQQAGPAMAFRGGMQRDMPFLGTAQMRARNRARVAAVGPGMTGEDILLGAESARGIASRPRAGSPLSLEAIDIENRRGELAFTKEKARLGGAESRRIRRLDRIEASRRESLAKISEPGVSLAGMAKPEAFQFAAQIARIGGGQALDMPREFFRTAFAAKTLYGVGPEVSGAFMQADRRGGLVGGAGRGGDAMAEAIGQATAIGLEGSEINDFLNVIASGIQDWKRTGMPINAGSIAGMARGIGVSIGAVRGMAVAQGMTAAAQGVAMGGPQGAMDMMMLQAAGYRGGGAAEFEQAQIALEKGLTAKQVGGLMKRLTRMGGGAESGRLFAKQMLREKGISISPSEMMALEKTGFKGLLEGGAVEGTTGGKLAREAAAALDPVTRRQALIDNKKIAAGNAMIKSVQDLDESSTNIAKQFSKELGPYVSDLTGLFKELTESLPGLISVLKGTATEGKASYANPGSPAVFDFLTGEGG